MQIQQISVTGLFGIFDHVIPLNMADRITIVHGPNGFGKTAMLRLLDGFFNSRYSIFWAVPFSKFQIDLDDGSSIDILKTTNRSKEKEEIKLNFRDRDLRLDSFSLKQTNSDRIRFSLRLLDDIPDLYRVNSKSWRYIPTNEIFSLEEAMYRFEDKIPAKFRLPKEPEWFKEFKSNIHVRLIESQRLLNVVDSSPSRRYGYGELDSEAGKTH